MSAPAMKILRASDVAKLMSMKDAIKVNREAFLAVVQGRVTLPDRLIMPVPKHDGFTLFKPAILADSNGGDNSMGAKIVSVRPNNAKLNLPTVPGFIVMLDEVTGYPAALMDGTYLTGLRTAAGSGAATEALARKDSSVLAVFGAGLQGHEHIKAVCAVRDIKKIVIWNRTPERAQKLIETLKTELNAGIEYSFEADANVAVKDADIVCTTTNSFTPVFNGENLKPGCHINAIGSFRPDMQELDAATIKRARVILDSPDAEKCGDIAIPLKENAIEKSHIAGDISQVLADQVKGRTSDTEITLFKSVGTSVQDVATAQAVLDAANKAGDIGVTVNLSD
eukprot:GFYU01009045.1.p1 GENE.GFYU01009045.1~~GFYU01009045.1.p1  ORF type:complete len:338 (+),score=118.19 GFYU01009045.1:173-1186(+)